MPGQKNQIVCILMLIVNAYALRIVMALIQPKTNYKLENYNITQAKTGNESYHMTLYFTLISTNTKFLKEIFINIIV